MIFETTVTNFLILGINFATSILAARLLGPDGRGALALVLLYPQAVANIGLLGIDRSVSILGGKKELSNPVLAIASISLALTVPAIIIIYSLVTLQIDDPELVKLSLVYSLYTPALYWFLLTISWFNGLGHFREYNLSRFAFYGSYLALLITLWVTKDSLLQGFVYANLVSVYVAMFVSGLFIFKRVRRPLFISCSTLIQDCISIFKKALVFLLPSILVVLATRLDQIILTNYLAVEYLGLFVVYLAFGRLIGPLANAINVNIFHFSISEGKYNISRIMRISIFVYFASLIIMYGMAPFAIGLLYGSEYTTHIASARILLVSSFFFFASQVFNEYLKGRSQGVQDTISQLLYIVILVVGGYVLIPLYSIAGLALSMAFGDFIKFVYLLLLFSKKTGFPTHTLVFLRKDDLVWVSFMIKLKLSNMKANAHV